MSDAPKPPPPKPPLEELRQRLTDSIHRGRLAWIEEGSGTDESLAKVILADLHLDVLTDDEHSLPLIVQIMQAQYLAMADTMNRQVQAAKASELTAWQVLADVHEAVDLQQRTFKKVGLNVGVPAVDEALAKATAAGLGRARYLLAASE